jgi:hypothetical protein
VNHTSSFRYAVPHTSLFARSRRPAAGDFTPTVRVEDLGVGASPLSRQLSQLLLTDSALVTCHVATFPALLHIITHVGCPWNALGSVHVRSSIAMARWGVHVVCTRQPNACSTFLVAGGGGSMHWLVRDTALAWVRGRASHLTERVMSSSLFRVGVLCCRGIHRVADLPVSTLGVCTASVVTSRPHPRGTEVDMLVQVRLPVGAHGGLPTRRRTQLTMDV